MEIEYLKPAEYDDLLTIRMIVPELPTVRMRFLYEVRNESGELLNKATTELVFTRVQDNRPVRPPAWFLELFHPFFGAD